MSEEQSYYEIALTNRQVVVAFVILLICLMGTFFAGVWVGRGEGPAAGAEQREAQAQAEEEGGIEELDFFGGGEEADEEKAEREEARPQTQPPAPPTTVPPRQEPEDTPPREAAPEPQAQAATPPPAQRPVPPRGQPVEGPIVQVFATAERARAQEVVDDLVDAGRPAYLEQGEADGRTVFRVRVGPFRDRAAAEQAADEIRRQHRLDTLVISQP